MKRSCAHELVAMPHSLINVVEVDASQSTTCVKTCGCGLQTYSPCKKRLHTKIISSEIKFCVGYGAATERGTNVINRVVSPTTDGGRIHFNVVAISLTPTIHFDRQGACSNQPYCFLHQPVSSCPLAFNLKL